MKTDLHTHSVASGHGTNDTINDLARAAAKKGVALLGVSDHAPAMANAARLSYFQNLIRAPRKRFGIRLLFGAELNILSADGRVDLPDSLIQALDYTIASLHSPVYTEHNDLSRNTEACINAMRHPGICIIGHPDDTHFPVDLDALVSAAASCHVLLELNNASLAPNGYRGDCRPADRTLLSLCSSRRVPVLIGSDSHGHDAIGDDQYARNLLAEVSFPSGLVANDNIPLLCEYIPGLQRA